jgi:predicted lipid-binding transport protein (Tim44 family)
MAMDIIILLIITIFIFVKLISEFGKVDEDQKKNAIRGFIKEKTKTENQANPAGMIVVQDAVGSDPKNIIDEKSQKILDAVPGYIKSDLILVLEKANISAANFILGAGMAFEMVVEAFASGNLEVLKPLLIDKLFQQFETVIKDRKSSGQTFNTRIFAVERSEIISAKIIGNDAFITVQFLSKQINYITNAAGAVIDGSKEQVNPVSDRWVFKKDVTSPNPNWIVVSTDASA